MVTRLMGGRTHPSQITIRNTSGRPAIFRITVTPGFAQAFGGFVQEDPGTPVTTRELADQEETTIRAFFRLPGRSPAGPKAFQVQIEEIDEAGRSRGIAATGTFAGLAEIEEEIEIPIDLGAPVGPPAIMPTAADMAFDFRDLLQTPTLTLAPAEVTKPRPSRGTATVPLSSPLPFAQPFRATLNVFLTQPGFQRRVSSTTLTVPRGGQELRQLFTVETVGLDPGTYNFRIEVIDPASNQLLQGFDLPQPILTVLGLAVPVAPVTPPPEAVPRVFDIEEEITAAVPLSEEQLLRGLALGPVEVLLPPVVVASRVPPGTPVTLSLSFRFPTPTAGTSLPGTIQPLRALVFLRGPLQQTTVQLLDTANFIIRPGQPNRLSSFTLPRNAERGPYTIQVFIVNPFDPTGPGGRANYLPAFGPGAFPAGFTVEPLPTAPRVFDIEEVQVPFRTAPTIIDEELELGAPEARRPRVFDIEDDGDFRAPVVTAAPPVAPTPTPVLVGITPISQIVNRVQPGQIALAGTRITADPAVLRRGQRTTLDFGYNNGSPVAGPTTISLRVIDRDGRIATQVPRFRTTIQLRLGFGAFQVPFTAPTILPNGVYGIELTMDRPARADPTGPTPVLTVSVLPVFSII